MRLVKKDVDYYQCEIHPAARDAYILSLKLKFQFSNHWREVFELNKLSPAWAIYDKESRRYLVFSGWKNLLPSCSVAHSKTSVLVYEEYEDIEDTAWHYLAKLVADSIHRNEIFYSHINLLDVFPTRLRERAEKEAGGIHSLESLTRFYSREPDGKTRRPPVRKAFERYQNEKRDAYAK